MIDILDDSYESDLTEEEHERLILMSEHAVAPPWSPSTLAVWRAFKDTPECAEVKLAAALRAASHELVPVPIKAEIPEEHWALLSVKNRLLAIADEFEGL